MPEQAAPIGFRPNEIDLEIIEALGDYLKQEQDMVGRKVSLSDIIRFSLRFTDKHLGRVDE